MAAADSAKRPHDRADGTAHERTYDPNDGRMWLVYPRGTRLPMKDWSVLKGVLVLALVLASIAGTGVLIWWFFAALPSR